MLSNPRRLTQLVALLLTAVAVVVLLLITPYTAVTTDSSGLESRSYSTVVAVNGPGFLAVLAIPLVIAVAPVVVRGRAWRSVSITAAALLAAFAVLAMLSLGMFFLPAVVAELVALAVPAGSRRATGAAQDAG